MVAIDWHEWFFKSFAARVGMRSRLRRVIRPVAVESLESRTLLTAELVLPLSPGLGGSVIVSDDFIGNDGRDEILAGLYEPLNFVMFQSQPDGSFPAVGGLDLAENGVRPVYSLVGDFNEDGNLDIIGSRSGDAGLSLSLGVGDGSFQRFSSFPNTHITNFVGSLNRLVDSHLDLIGSDIDELGNITHHRVDLGNGDGTFSAHVITSIPAASNIYAARDFNADGNLDVLALMTDGPTPIIAIYYGDGTADGFRLGPTLDATADIDRSTSIVGDGFGHTQTPGLLLGNFTGDANVDLLLGYGISRTEPFTVNTHIEHHILVYQNSGSSFSLQADIQLPRKGLDLGPTNLFYGVAGDLNGDGYDEAILSTTGVLREHFITGTYDPANELFILAGSSGGLRNAVMMPIEGYVNDLTTGDFNGDGKLDIATVTRLTADFPPPFEDGVHVYLNPGPAASLSLASTAPLDVNYGLPVSRVSGAGRKFFLEATVSAPGGEVKFYDNLADGTKVLLTTVTSVNGVARLDSEDPALPTGSLGMGAHVFTAEIAGGFGGSISNTVYQYIIPEDVADLFTAIELGLLGAPAPPPGIAFSSQVVAPDSVGGSFTVSAGHTMSIIVSAESPAPPPNVIVTFHLNDGRTLYADLTYQKADMDPIATQFVYTYDVPIDSPEGWADVTVNGADLEGHVVRALTERFYITNAAPTALAQPVGLRFQIFGHFDPNDPNIANRLTDEVNAGKALSVDPNFKEAITIDARGRDDGSDDNRRVMIYPITKLPPNAYLVDQTNHVVDSATGLVGGDSELRVFFQPSATQAGRDYEIKFGVLDLTNGSSGVKTLRLHVTGAQASQKATLTSSTLSIPTDGSSFVVKMDLNGTPDVNGKITNGDPMRPVPTLLVRVPGSTEFSVVAGNEFLAANFRPSGTSYLLTLSPGSGEAPPGVYEYKARVLPVFGQAGQEIETNSIKVYIGGPRASVVEIDRKLKQIGQQLDADARRQATQAVLLQINGPGKFPAVGTHIRLIDGTAGIVAAGAAGGLIVADAFGNAISRGGGSIVAVGAAGNFYEVNGSGQIIAAGAGNIVAPGAGGNIIAAGAGIIAAGAGNIVAPGAAGNIVAVGAAGNIIAPGAGGNIIAAGAASGVFAAMGGIVAPGAGGGIIAAGAGNIVAPGAANIIAAGAGNIIAAGAGNIIAAGAGNVVPHPAPLTVSGPSRLTQSFVTEATGPTAPSLASTTEGAAFDALLYTQYELWHNYLLDLAGMPFEALEPRLNLATESLDAMTALLDGNLESLTPEEMAALERAGLVIPLDVALASPGGMLAPGSRIVITPRNSADVLTTGGASESAGDFLPMTLAGTVITFGGDLPEEAQPGMDVPFIQLYGEAMALYSATANRIEARVPQLAPTGQPQLIVLTTADGRLAIGAVTLARSTGEVSFNSASYMATESGGTATITVQRTGGSDGFVAYTIGTSNGTGLAGTNYTETGGFVFFEDGDSSPKTFTIPVLDDFVAGNGNKTVNLALINTIDSGAESSLKTALLTIADTPPEPADFGDAPDTYGTSFANDGARHVASGPQLGAGRDVDADGQPNATATGDDANGDDEDGVQLSAAINRSATVTAVVTASSAGQLDAWIDFNRDGDFGDSGEQIAANLTLVAGTNNVVFDVPGDASLGTSFARFRLSTSGNLAPTGLATDGEVEDYQVTIAGSQVVPPQLTLGGSDVTWVKKQPPLTVLPAVTVEGTNLAGGTLTLSMNAPGKKKAFDLLTAPSFAALGTSSGLQFADGHLTFQINLGSSATAASIQAFLRGIKFATKGGGLKALTRTLSVTLANASGQSSQVSQTINVRKKA